MATSFLSAAELKQNLNNPDWVIVDCRNDLLNADWGHTQYLTAHIPGAVYADLKKDLSSPATPKTSRHPLPEAQEFFGKLSGWGINASKQVVVYDHLGGTFAVRLWWMLNFYGNENVAILDGGFPAWEAAGFPTKSGEETTPPVLFTPASIHSEMLVQAADVEKIRQLSDWKLIDARAPERFKGEIEPIDPIAGHIPGAINRFAGANLTPAGLLKPLDQLKSEFETLLGDTPIEKAVFYCGSGVTSCFHIAALKAIGVTGAKLYAGSWSEWIRDPQHPITKGE
jgi:thiosulfate/3-mercaptopyruvate sulfurtransferase